MKSNRNIVAGNPTTVAKLVRIKQILSERYLGVPRFGAQLAETLITKQLSPNLIGVGVAEKRRNRRYTGILGITFYVKRKISKANLPEGALLPKEFDGFACDVVPCHYSRPCYGGASSSDVHVPLRAGCQIGVSANHWGTLGGFMRDSQGSRFFVSNCHVLSPFDLSSSGNVVYQPAPGVAGSRRIGVVTHVVPLLQVNDVDLALARIDDGVEIDTINYWGRVPGTSELRLNRAAVRKFGAGNEVRQGRFEAIQTDWGWDINGVNYKFRNLHAFRPATFAVPGDSGTLVASSLDNSWVSMIAGTSRSIDCGIPVAAIERELLDYTWDV